MDELAKVKDWTKPTKKQRKFVCTKCGDYRMLNKDVTLCLCHNCDYIQMVSENKLRKLTNRKEEIKSGEDKNSWFSKK